MTLKFSAKLKGKPTCGLKNDIKNSVNFRASKQKSEKSHFDWILLSKAYKDLDEKIKRLMFHDTDECPKSDKKLMLGSKNDMRNLVNFNVTSGKSESLHFDVLIFPITYKVSARKSTEE